MSNAVLKIIDNAVKKTELNAALNTVDYINKDGLLVCGKCQTLKQKKMNHELFGGEKIISHSCQCQHEKDKKEQKEFEYNQRQMKVEILKNQAISDQNYFKFTFENDDGKNPKVSNACKKYANNFPEMLAKNNGLIFCGNVGTGKTFMAVCIANAVLNLGYSALVTNIPSLINTLSGNQDDKNYTLKQIAKVDLLVLDDLGVERDTSYAIEKIFEIIDTRYRSGKPLVVTTNLKIKDMKTCDKESYKRIYDRVLEFCFPIPVLGESRRIRESEAKNMEMKNFLGI